MANFTVNGVSIKNPTTFKIERYNVTTLERLADATMAGDLIAQKRKFYFTYDAITGEELNKILGAIFTSKLFFTLKYPDATSTKTATVYTGSIPVELHRYSSGSTVWKGFNFNLIER